MTLASLRSDLKDQGLFQDYQEVKGQNSIYKIIAGDLGLELIKDHLYNASS